MGFDYNYFTKAELVSFLNQYDGEFKYLVKPYLVIIEEKQNRLHKKLDQLSNDNKKLLIELGEVQADVDLNKYIKISKQLSENHKKWEKIHQKLDELSNLAYSR